MSGPIRVLHFADLHIGMENYGQLDPETGLNRRVMDFLERLDFLVDYAIEHKADLVLFAGDAFRTRTPSPTHQREFARRVRRLSEAKISTVLLLGNHDVSIMAQRASSVEIFDTLAVDYVNVVSQPDLLRIETPNGPVQVAGMPYPVRQRLLTREQFRHLSQEALDRTVTDTIVTLLNKLAQDIDPSIPAILMGHFSVAGAHWGSERNIMIGRDVTVPLSALADPVWDYVALGHIHQHQSLNSESHPPVIYAGSLERVDFGEENQSKGFYWIKLQRGKAEWRYIKVPARPFHTIRVDVRDVSNPLETVQDVVFKHKLEGTVARLVVQMTPEQEPHLRDKDFSSMLADAFFAQINREVDRSGRDRLDGLEPEAMTPEHLLERYLWAKGKTEEEAAVYLEEARAIFQAEG